MLFGNFWFCQFWGISYEPFPYYSVFLVLAMSTLRTILLYKPFWRISKPLVAKVIIPYFFILIFRFTMAAIFVGHYKYETFSGYAWNHMTIKEYMTFDLVLSNALMAFPIIPIILMCIFNVKKIWETGAKKKFSISKPGADVNMPKKSFSQSISQAFSSTSGKASTFGDTVVTSGKLSTQSKRTSETVIIFTVIYICCNIPVFINVFWFTIIQIFGVDILNGNSTNKWFTDNHFWALTYISLVIINSTCNPFIYLFRIKDYRDFVLSKFKTID